MPADIIEYEEINGIKYPVIACVGRRNDARPQIDYYGQVTFMCPFCGKQHFHGAGGPSIGDGDGHRSAHCMKKTPANEFGYILKETTSNFAAGISR